LIFQFSPRTGAGPSNRLGTGRNKNSFELPKRTPALRLVMSFKLGMRFFASSFDKSTEDESLKMTKGRPFDALRLLRAGGLTIKCGRSKGVTHAINGGAKYYLDARGNRF
jgi:hypothetical protein